MSSRDLSRLPPSRPEQLQHTGRVVGRTAEFADIELKETSTWQRAIERLLQL